MVESINQSIVETIEHENLQNSKELNATMTCKWGIDGTGGHGSELVITSLCALTLSIKKAPGEFLVWKNQSPGSPHSTRCIEIEQIKENDKHTTETFKKIQLQIKNLKTQEIYLSNLIKLKINYIFICSMIDDKVAKVLNEIESTSNCTFCNSTSKDMNNLNNFKNGKFEVKKDFVCLFHLCIQL